MGYNKQNFRSGQTLTANHLNNIENGIVANETAIAEKQSSESCSEFLKNIKVDYFWDEESNTNYSMVRVFKKRIDGKFQYPHVYVPNGTGKPIESALDCALNHGWYLTINAGCGGTYGSPNGTLIQDGKVVQQGPTEQHPTAMPLTIDNNGDLWYASADADAEALVNSGIVSAVCGFMPIIKEYAPVPESEWITDINHFNTGAQRQIIGQFWNGDYAIITCEGRNNGNSTGFTIAQAQAVCKKHGLKFAYNLDGGGSTGLVIDKKMINTIYEGTTGRKVPAFIVFNGETSLFPNTGI